MRIVDLHDRDAFVAQQLDFAAQDRHAVADEIVALRIGLRRFLRIPHPLAEQGRGRHGGLEVSLRQLLEKRDFLGDEARLLRRELVDDDGPRPAVGRVAAEFEAVGQFGDHADVAFAPPFAVGDDVEAGRFLQCDGGANGARPSGGRIRRRRIGQSSAISSRTNCGRGREPMTDVGNNTSAMIALQ